MDDVDHRTVVIGTRPPRAAGTANTVAVSAAAVRAGPDSPPPSLDNRFDQGGRGNARSSPIASPDSPGSSTQGAKPTERTLSLRWRSSAYGGLFPGPRHGVHHRRETRAAWPIRPRSKEVKNRN